MDDRRLEERVDALERAVTDGHADDGLPDAARIEARVADLEATMDDIDDRVADLDAAVQALRGFAGGLQAVDESVEQRANAAIARVDRLEAELRRAGGSTADTAPKEPDETAADGRRNGESTRHRAASEPHDGERVETPIAPANGETATDSGTGHTAASDHVPDATTRDATVDGVDRDAGTDTGTDRDGTLHGTVTARSDAALADAAASADRPDDETEPDRSLADRLRRLL